MTPDQLSELIRSAVKECEFDGESSYGLRLLAHNLGVEILMTLGKFDRDQWIKECGF